MWNCLRICLTALLGVQLAVAAAPADVAMTAPDTTRDSACPAITIARDDAASAPDRRRVCRGAALARAFLAGHAIDVQRPIRIQLHDRAMRPGHAHHIGLYDRQADHVDLLTYAAASELTTRDALFGEAMNPTLYRSVVAHEIAHAITEQNLDPRQTSRVAHEYIAYVTQLSTLPAGQRESILTRYPAPGYADVDEMSWVYYELDPSAFGVKAYRHFIGLADRAGFLQGLLSGDIRPGSANGNGW